MEEENMIYILRDGISLGIAEAERLHGVVKDNIAMHSFEEALLEYEEFAPELVDIERNIKTLELDLKVCEIRQQRLYKEKGVKTVKEQEQLTREAMLDVRKLLEEYKGLRDKLRVKRTIYECIIRRGEGI